MEVNEQEGQLFLQEQKKTKEEEMFYTTDKEEYGERSVNNEIYCTYGLPGMRILAIHNWFERQQQMI